MRQGSSLNLLMHSKFHPNMFQQFTAIIPGGRIYLRSYSINICIVGVYGLNLSSVASCQGMRLGRISRQLATLDKL
jgi:hypothetical protein